MAAPAVWQQRHLDAATVALAVLDRNGNIVQINGRCSEQLQASAGPLTGQNWFELFLPPEQRQAATELYRQVMAGEAGEPLRQFETAAIVTSPQGRQYSWRHTLLRDEQGGIEGAVCRGEDVTDFLQTEQTLRFESEEQSALNTILRISLEDIPLRQQFERVLDILLGLSWLPLEPKGGIFQVAEGEETLTLIAQRGLPPILQRECAHVPFGHCLCGIAAATREVQYADCIDERHAVTYPGIAPHGHYNVPILSRRGVLGVIVLYLSHGHRKQDREIEFLGSVANTLAGIIEHRQTQEALLASRGRLAEAQRIGRLGGWEWDITTDRFYFSEETCRILDQPAEGVWSSQQVLGLVHADDRASVQLQLTEGRQRGRLHFDCRVVLADGQEKYLHLEGEAQRTPAGAIERFYGTLQDITERKLAEAEQRLAATVFRSTAEAVMITDPGGRIVTANRAFTEITGYQPEEIGGQTTAAFKSGRHSDEFYTAMWETLATTGRWRGELWNRRKNGEVYPTWLNINAVRDDHGTVTHYVGVFSDITAMKESENRLDHLAHHDTLTGLPNRLLLNGRLEQAFARAHRNQTMVAVLLLDLDHFKVINDTLGHPVGDLLLKEAAARLGHCTREDDTVARLGGDEFTVLLEDQAGTRGAGVIAQKIIAAIEERFILNGHEVFVTASIGIAIYPADGSDATTLLKNADSALYRAKEQGRNNYQYYTQELTARAMERLAMETDLRHALERNELMVYYQPQVDLYNGQTIGMEALLRWQHPERGMIPPAVFIPLAEETTLIIPIGEWVLRTACTRLKAWLDAGLPKIRVAVNLSSRQFNQKNLADVVAGILQETGLPPQHLELELTESLIMSDAESSIKVLEKLRRLGVQFSIDDFGTGYSSLSYLKRFPIDRIKIDQSFVRNITSDPQDAAVSQAIISLSHSLNMTVVAEGVETAEQREFLRKRQCDEIQGFHFSRPVPEHEMERMLRESGAIQATPAAEAPNLRTLLLVDDEKPIVDALRRTLRPEGYRIVTAQSGDEALALLAIHRVDVIVSDQRMPGISGTELLNRVRTLYPQTVRIMLTAYADAKTIAEAINEGAIYKFLAKPWDDEELREVVRLAFRHHEALVHNQADP